MPNRRNRSAFTLIELLVVVAIISVLASILVPVISNALSNARKTACKPLLRGYEQASQSFTREHNDLMLDSYKHLDATMGIPRYWLGDTKLPEQVSRCPGDGATESLGRLGTFSQYDNLRVSIGCNENTLSASARMTSLGPQAFWVLRSELKGNPYRMMTWADWQNNPYEADCATAIVKPANTGMGSLVFRHGGVSNAVYMDGHVGEMAPTVALTNNGHDLQDGDWPAPNGKTPIAKFFKTFYPFGPAKGFEASCNGDWPTIQFE
ncbi:MAG: type II secretion system protein [Planctomycetaceae bacterium]